LFDADEAVADSLAPLLPLAIRALQTGGRIARGDGDAGVSVSAADFLLSLSSLAPVKAAFFALFWTDETARAWEKGPGAGKEAGWARPAQPLHALLDAVRLARGDDDVDDDDDDDEESGGAPAPLPPSAVGLALRTLALLMRASADVASAARKYVAGTSGALLPALREVAADAGSAAAAAAAPGARGSLVVARTSTSSVFLPPGDGSHAHARNGVLVVRVKGRAARAAQVQPQPQHRQHQRQRTAYGPEAAAAAAALLAVLA
jgi:hypothetical protein